MRDLPHLGWRRDDVILADQHQCRQRDAWQPLGRGALRAAIPRSAAAMPSGGLSRITRSMPRNRPARSAAVRGPNNLGIIAAATVAVPDASTFAASSARGGSLGRVGRARGIAQNERT